MAGSWVFLKSTAGTGSSDTLDSGTWTGDYKYLRVVCFSEATGGAIQSNIRFNGTGSSDNDYCFSHSKNGSSDTSRLSRNDIEPYQTATHGTGTSSLVVLDILNILNREKLVQGHTVKQGTVGAGTAPDRVEFVGKYVDNALITSVQFCNNGGDAGSFSTNSTVTVWGADDAPLTYPSLPNGSVFITSDTNVHYMWNGTDTWNEVA